MQPTYISYHASEPKAYNALVDHYVSCCTDFHQTRVPLRSVADENDLEVAKSIT